MTQVSITYTTQEAADLLKITSRAVQLRAKREGWDCQERAKRLGGKLWIVQSMPESTREQISATLYQQMQAEQPESLRAPRVPDLPAVLPVNLATWQREIMEARLILLEEVRRIALIEGIIKAEKLFAKMAKTGELSQYYQDLIAKANARKGKGRALSASTLRNWRRIKNKEGAEGLAPKVTQAPLNKQFPEWLMPFLREWRLPSKPSISQIYYDFKNTLNLPSLRTVERKVAALGELEKNRGRLLPREIKRFKAFVRRDFKKLLPTDVYTADGHTMDMYVLHPAHGKPFRPEVTSIVDVATRKCVGWSIGLAENSWGVADAIRMSVVDHGICAIFYVDNGSGFKNTMLDSPGVGMLARLGVSKEHSLPYASQARGLIERFQRELIRNARRMPGYCGMDMDKEAAQLVRKKALKEIKHTGTTRIFPTWEQFMKMMKMLVAEYNNRPHSSLPKVVDSSTGKKRNQSPNERWAVLKTKADIIIPDETEAADLFRPYEIRTVSRCEINLYRNRYFSKGLEDYHRQEVQVGYDIHDASKVWVRDLDGRFICEAGFEANSADYFPMPVVEQAREKRAQGRKKRLQVHMDEVDAELHGIGGALEAAPVAQKLKMTPAQEAIQVELTREFEQNNKSIGIDLKTEMPGGGKVINIKPVNDNPIPADPIERYRLAMQLEEKISQGINVNSRLAVWLGSYQSHAEYMTHKQMCDEFGVAAILG
ncbi:Mu transposase C-terminal domain-containing protein [Maridesulfovibrio hydrothermalis]|uniref:Transposase n=1 Tax=Maridesulfovibrio hydrothermalis AM13 = DSM 14728 TaxID=1121451 RepID=L0R7K5_9BACT|nr:Mu transposase C-terminal domain-containing protein [Maridesulfovibrio hydrothermalis]CCO22202.1 transposase [Maridesulfovibrio hydrothermalis AM13 = DSM 14728]